jgi:hypothetical protein
MFLGAEKTHFCPYRGQKINNKFLKKKSAKTLSICSMFGGFALAKSTHFLVKNTLIRGGVKEHTRTEALPLPKALIAANSVCMCVVREHINERRRREHAKSTHCCQQCVCIVVREHINGKEA